VYEYEYDDDDDEDEDEDEDLPLFASVWARPETTGLGATVARVEFIC